MRRLKEELTRDGYVSKARRAGSKHTGGKPFVRGALYTILKNPVYIGKVAHKGKLHRGKHEPLLDPGVWKDVQERLAANRHRKRTRANAGTPSLLAGFLFDDRGNPMSPTQTHRGSRRYRYYISQALLQYREHEAVPAPWYGHDKRVSALMIEVGRWLYMDEARGEKRSDFNLIKARLQHALWRFQHQH